MLPGHPPKLLDEIGLSPPSKTSLSLSRETPPLRAGQLGAHPLCDSLAGAKCLREVLESSSPGRSRGGLRHPRARLAAFTPLALPAPRLSAADSVPVSAGSREASGPCPGLGATTAHRCPASAGSSSTKSQVKEERQHNSG